MKLICTALLVLIPAAPLAAAPASASDTLTITVVSTVDGAEVAKSVLATSDDTPTLFADNVFVEHATGPVLTCRAGRKECSGAISLTGPLRMGLTAVISARRGGDGEVLVEVDGRYALKESGNSDDVIRMTNYQLTGARAVRLGEMLDVESSDDGHVVKVSIKVEQP